MLILSRRPGESLTFCEANLLHAKSPLRTLEIDMEKDTIQLFVLGASEGKVRLGIQAPKDIAIRSSKVDLSNYANRAGRY